MPSKTSLAILGAGALVGGAGCFGAFRVGERYLDYRVAAGELPQAEREYRATGLPWTAADLRPRPIDPAAVEAARLIRRAGLVVTREKWTKDATRLRSLVDADDLVAAETRLAAHAPTLALFERAAVLGHVDFGRDLDQGVFGRFPEFSPIRAAVTAFGARARVRAARRDLAGARRDLRTMRALGRMAESDGLLIALLTRTACDALADDATQRAVARNPGLAAGALADLEPPVPPPDLARTARYEAYAILATVRNTRAPASLSDLKGLRGGESLRTELDPAKLRREGVPDALTARAYTARELQLWTRIAGPLRSDARDPVRLGAAIDRLVRAEDAEPGLSHVVNRVAFPLFAVAGVVAAKDAAGRAITLAYLRAIATRERTGNLPRTLISGVDPFGNPYIGRREGAGFRIYSPGANGIDDGGLTTIERRARGIVPIRTDDVVAAFPPPRRRP